MKYWFVKSGPNTWPWRDPLKPPQQTAEWDEVCNYHGKRHLAMMRMGGKEFFCHSGKEKAVVGIVQVVKEYSPGHTDPTETFGMVDFKVVKSIEEPVMLADIKAQVQLKRLTLVSIYAYRSNRLRRHPERLFARWSGVVPEQRVKTPRQRSI